jgi:hypothetical protein
MQRRSLIIFVILNVLISLGVAFVVINLVNQQNQTPTTTSQAVITVQLIVTATPGPTQTPFIVTSTPPDGVVVLPTGLLVTPIGGAGTGSGAVIDAPTIDPTLLGADVALQATASALPSGCILHTLQEGDTPFAVAEQYGADGFALMEVNGLDEDSARFLQEGQVLIVPLEGCTLTAAALAAGDGTEEVVVAETATLDAAQSTATLTNTATIMPTNTLPPTAANAQLEILTVANVGDVTAEYVDIRNNGAIVDLTGWTLRDSQGNIYTFPAQRRLFTNGRISIYSRVGTDTGAALFWNQTTAVWESGDSVTLLDNSGRAQSVYLIP